LLKTSQLFFQEALSKNGEASEYLQIHRKLTPEIIEQFGVGFSPDSYDQLITFLTTKGFTQEQMIQSGIAKLNQNNQIFSFFRGRITFPIFNQHDALIGF
jgi:DNA primase